MIARHLIARLKVDTELPVLPHTERDRRDAFKTLRSLRLALFGYPEYKEAIGRILYPRVKHVVYSVQHPTTRPLQYILDGLTYNGKSIPSSVRPCWIRSLTVVLCRRTGEAAEITSLVSELEQLKELSVTGTMEDVPRELDLSKSSEYTNIFVPASSCSFITS